MTRLDTSMPSLSPRISPTSPLNKRPGYENNPRFFFDLALLEPTTLSVASLPASVQQLEDHLDSTTVSFIVSRSLRLYCALEYILSAITEPSYQLLSDWIIGLFPASLAEFLEPSLSTQCLARLAVSIASSDVVALIRSDASITISSTLILATAVLKALASMLDDDGTFADANATASRGVKQRRKPKASSRVVPTVDEKPFKDFGASIPETREEATALAESILMGQRNALQELLTLIRRPELKEKLRDDFLVHGPNSDGYSSFSQSTSVVSRSTASDSTDFGDLHAYLTYPSPNGFGRWRILLAGRAAKDIDNLRKSGSGLYDIVLQKLRELSWGQFSPTNHKKITHSSPVPIFEVRLPSNPRLIYQIDCVRETKNDTPRQVLLVYGIYDHKGVSRTPWDKYGKQQARRGPEYVNACRYRSQPRVAGSDIFEPAEFPNMTVSLDMVHSLPDVDEEAPDTALSKAEARELHSLLVLGRHAMLSENFLEALKQDDDIAQIHQLSDRERDVVEHIGSSFVLGRSGTGKTTTILFKIFGIERAWEHLSHARAARPRQLFVTKSSLLAKKVEQEFITFIKYDTMAEDAPRHFVQRVARSEDLDTDALFTNEDLGEWRAGLPSRYSELTDDHFPLFLTYNELCILLENDFKAEDELREAKGAPWDHYARYDSDEVVNFDTFTEHYWSRLPAELTRQTVPSVAYGEMVGICEGSEDTLNSTLNRLSRSQYEERRVQHVDYAHFEAYLRIKAERGERDSADRAHDLLRRLQSGAFPGRRIDFLYVDEVQDNILVEISREYPPYEVLRRICRNPNGLFWAGDTAQTISHGSAFRFADLTAFMYRFEQNLVATASQPIVKPAFFQLAINYRSPGGVVDCARSVVDLLKLFPLAVDNLDREEGIIQGLRPLFVKRGADRVAQDFFQIGADGRAAVILGHNQCILVRDEAARTRLKKDMNLGSVGIILTIYDSKGLEFDDILLYDFFADSAVDVSLWRHLFEACGDLPGPEVKRYDIKDRRHSPLAAELKHLYVAVTRTRRNLWILETSSDRCDPMKEYWFKRNLIEDANPDVTLAGFSETSAAKDWAQTASRLFTRRNYEEAILAFERAGDERRVRLAEAFLAKKLAGGLPSGRRRREAYEATALKLLACASEATMEKEIRGIFVAVADCYVELNDHERAAGAFEQARNWSKAADHYYKAKLLDKAVALIKEDKERPRAEIDGKVKSRIVETAKCAYLETLRLQDARELFDPKDDENIDEFVESHDFINARVQLLEDRQEVAAAARLLFEEGQSILALRKLVDHSGRTDCVQTALELGFQFLRAHLSLGSHTLPTRRNSEAALVASLLSELPSGCMNQSQQRELALYYDMAGKDWAALKRSGIVSFVRHGGAAFGLLCFDKYFSDMSHIAVEDPASLLTFVDLFGRYVREMRKVIMHATLDDPEILGIQVVDQDRVELLPDTLAGHAYERRHGAEATRRVQHAAILDLIRSELSLYLKQKIKDQLAKIQVAARILDACTTLSRTGTCRKVHTSHVAHELDEQWYNKRIQFHLQQIEILHIVHQIPHAEDFRARVVQQTTWLGRLENAMNPLIYLNGSQSTFDPSIVTVSSRSLPIVKQWSLDVLFHLDPTDSDQYQQSFLTNFLIAAKLGMRIDVQDKGRTVLRRLATVPCVTDRRKAHSRLFDRAPNGQRFYVLPYLADYLRGFGNVKQGVECLNFIAERRLPVDLGTLCDFADRLTGVFILTRAHQLNRSVHEVTLPRSWVVELWPEVFCYKGRNAAEPARLVDILIRLLIDVHADNIFQRSKVYLDLPRDAARDACMSRICRSLCLIAYNVVEQDLREKIVRTINSFKKGDASFAPLSRPYLLSASWSDLAMAAIRSCRRHISDNMIQLCLSSRRRPQLASPEIEQIVFDSMADIPAVLGFDEQLLPTTIREAQESSSTTGAVTEPAPAAAQVDATENKEAVSLTGEPSFAEGSNLADEASDPLADEPESTQSAAPHAHTEPDSTVIAARIIQETWHWRRVPPGTLPAALHRQIRSHRIRASSMTLSPTHRAVFIVHLPRLLLCIEHILTGAREERANCKRRRTRAAKDHDLDLQLELGSRVKELHAVERATEALNTALRPESNLHTRAGSLMELQKCALEVERLAAVVPRDAAVSAELELALRGIDCAGTRDYEGSRAKSRKRAIKPTLNIEDL